MRSRWFTPTLLRAWMLAALLLAAQAAGLAHRIAHTPGAGGAFAQAVTGASHEAGSADCRLIDQLSHADALCSPPAWAPAPPPAPVVQASVQPRFLAARPAAAYLARAPPQT